MIGHSAREQLALLLYGELIFRRRRARRVASGSMRGVPRRPGAGTGRPRGAGQRSRSRRRRRCCANAGRICSRPLARRSGGARGRARRLVGTSSWTRSRCGPSAGWLRPAGALTLIALGFFAARVCSRWRISASAWESRGYRGRGRRCIACGMSSRRRTAGSRSCSMRRGSGPSPGNLDDQPIRALLLSAAKDPSDPGLRAETVDILNGRAQWPIFAMR